MVVSAVRVAYRWLAASTLQDLDAAFRVFQESTRTLETRPGHASAAMDGFHALKDVLRLILESGAPNTDEALNRSLAYHTKMWNTFWAQPHTNEWFGQVGEAFSGEMRSISKLVQRAKDKMRDSAEVRPAQIGGVSLRDATGLDVVAEYQPMVELAIRTLERKRVGAVARCDVVLVLAENMPPVQGHAAAMYRNTKDTIYIAHPSPDQRDRVERLLHEFGHRHWFRILGEQGQIDWTRSWSKTKEDGARFVTSYASTHPFEDYAECFALWCLDRLPEYHQHRLEAILQ